MLGALASEISAGGDGLGELFGDLDHLVGGSVIILQLVDYDDHDDGCDGCSDGGDGELEVEFEFLFLLGEVGNVVNVVGHYVLPFFEGIHYIPRYFCDVH